MLATRSPQMRKAVGVLKELSADEATRMLYEKREMARMDYESRVEEVEKKWQNVVEEKDAENEKLRAQLVKLQLLVAIKCKNIPTITLPADENGHAHIDNGKHPDL